MAARASLPDPDGTPRTVVLFWDIDGTLLSTARAGIYALEDAAREVVGGDVDFSELHTAGLTDYQIAAIALVEAGGTATEETVEAFVASYERHLPERLPSRRGHVMPGVVEILSALEGRDDVLSLLLTGNTPAGARAKLRHYELDHLLEDGGFSAYPGDRADIARRALDRARQALGETPRPEDTYVIGDTPHDVDCARAIDARTVAVATGSYSSAELGALGPWWTLERLPPVAEFVRHLGLARAPA